MIRLSNAETGGDRSFHPENDYVSEEPIDVERFDLFYNMTSPSVDVISSFINRGAVYDDWMKVSGGWICCRQGDDLYVR